MSADTTVVIAAYRSPGDSELSYTAAVVQAAADFADSTDDGHVVGRAEALFITQRHPWFRGKGALSRAKQFANLLAWDLRENGYLEYDDQLIIEIESGEGRVYALSRKGRRRPLRSA